MSAAPILTILRDGETIQKHPIEGEAILGRSDKCLIRLEDRAISRQHVAFKVTAAGVQVEKKSAFAPLLVNGKDCTRTILKEGDIISLGPYVLTLSAPTSSRAAPEALLPEETPSLAAPKDFLPADSLLDPVDPPLASPVSGDPGQEQEVPELQAPPLESSASGADSGAQFGLDPSMQLGGQTVAPLDLGSVPVDSQPAGVFLDSPIQEPAPTAELFEPAGDNSHTKLSPSAKLAVKLVFPPGQANVQEFELSGNEICIGRGKSCDVVLFDKKASRKHTLIRKAGVSFVLKDLGSSNGTLVNGARVTETELAGDDVIQIGDTEFRFIATSLDYDAKKNSLLPLEVSDTNASSELVLPDISLPEHDFPLPQDNQAVSQPGGSSPSLAWPQPNHQIPGLGSASTGAINGIPGVAGVGTPQASGSLLGKYRALPKRQRLLIIAVVAFGALYLIDDPPSSTDSKDAGKGKRDTQQVAQKVRTYESLSEKEKAFVEAKIQEAMDHFQKPDYDSAIDAAKQVLALLPGYERAVEIENFAIQRKEALLRAEELRRAQEEQERLKRRIADLVNETGIRMKKRQYEQARELFAEVLALDPDNAQIAQWRRELEEVEENERMRAQEAQVRADINRHAWGVYREGLAQQKAGRHHVAIRTFTRVRSIGATDKKLLSLAKSAIEESRDAVASRRDPLMSEARMMEDSGEFAQAYQLYHQASEVDPSHSEAKSGMARLKGILHDKAKAIYTEAVLAESYSDFSMARQKFKQCMEVAPKDDIYYQRAQRKLANYLKFEERVQ